MLDPHLPVDNGLLWITGQRRNSAWFRSFGFQLNEQNTETKPA